MFLTFIETNFVTYIQKQVFANGWVIFFNYTFHLSCAFLSCVTLGLTNRQLILITTLFQRKSNFYVYK